MKYIIEHLEPELFEWCFLEYKHMSEIVGKENLMFTNTDDAQLKELGKISKESVLKLELEKPCLLDMGAELTLQPDDEFSTLIFGGILGDDPPRDRTKVFFKDYKGERRNLGKRQMSTDTAVLVAKMIIEDIIPFDQIKFEDDIEIETNDGESVILPYRYVIKYGKPVLPEGLIEHLKKEDNF